MDADLARMLDEHAITNLAARFDDAAMRRDVPAFRAVWTGDGVWDIGAPNTAWAGRGGGAGYHDVGFYDDDLGRTPAGRRFARRSCHVVRVDNAWPIAGQTVPLPFGAG